jgi:hypothetical protein
MMIDLYSLLCYHKHVNREFALSTTRAHALEGFVLFYEELAVKPVRQRLRRPRPVIDAN